MLLDNNADLSVKDDLGRSPWDIAKRVGLPRILTRLHKVNDRFGMPDFKKIENSDFQYVYDENGLSVFKAVKR